VLRVRCVDGEEAVRRMRRAIDLGIILIYMDSFKQQMKLSRFKYRMS
jgi:hypothetical protein